jgi:hypothetical protein
MLHGGQACQQSCLPPTVAPVGRFIGPLCPQSPIAGQTVSRRVQTARRGSMSTAESSVIQYPEDTLLMGAGAYRIDARPLESWFGLIGFRPAFRQIRPRPADTPFDSADTLRAGDYSATWSLGADGMLRLTGITALWPDGTPVTLGHLFPLTQDAILARWYSGVIRARYCGAGSVPATAGLIIELERGRQAGSAGLTPSADPLDDGSAGWACGLV